MRTSRPVDEMRNMGRRAASVSMHTLAKDDFAFEAADKIGLSMDLPFIEAGNDTFHWLVPMAS